MPDSIRGARVLIAEDEELISLVLQDMVDMLGGVVAGVATTVEEAAPLAAADGYDVAILDVHLNGDEVYPVADAARAAGMPVIFATGSGRDGLPDRYADSTLLPKPYALPALEAALTEALARRA